MVVGCKRIVAYPVLLQIAPLPCDAACVCYTASLLETNQYKVTTGYKQTSQSLCEDCRPVLLHCCVYHCSICMCNPLQNDAPSLQTLECCVCPAHSARQISCMIAVLQANNLQMIVRAHECVMDGFERFAQGHLITLFSATNYCGTANNAGKSCSRQTALIHVMLNLLYQCL